MDDFVDRLAQILLRERDAYVDRITDEFSTSTPVLMLTIQVFHLRVVSSSVSPGSLAQENQH